MNRDVVVHPLAAPDDVTLHPLQAYAVTASTAAVGLPVVTVLRLPRSSAVTATATALGLASVSVLHLPGAPPTPDPGIAGGGGVRLRPSHARPPMPSHTWRVHAATTAVGLAGCDHSRPLTRVQAEATAAGVASCGLDVHPFGRWAEEEFLLDLV